MKKETKPSRTTVEVSRDELCRRLRQRSLENLIAASAAASDGETAQAKRYRLAARVFASWAEELLAPAH
jgi:hypothetical protein